MNLVKRAKSQLKEILDAREGDEKISIRQLAEKTDIQFETLRRLYHDTSKQYSRETIGRVCEVLGIEVNELLILVEDDEYNKKKNDSN